MCVGLEAEVEWPVPSATSRWRAQEEAEARAVGGGRACIRCALQGAHGDVLDVHRVDEAATVDVVSVVVGHGGKPVAKGRRAVCQAG